MGRAKAAETLSRVLISACVYGKDSSKGSDLKVNTLCEAVYH